MFMFVFVIYYILFIHLSNYVECKCDKIIYKIHILSKYYIFVTPENNR